VSDKLGKMWEEGGMSFIVGSLFILAGGTQENNEKSQAWVPVSQPKFGPSISQLQFISIIT
jgi:hypothetical protein